MEELINDLNELLKGRSNIISKDELETVLKLYYERQGRKYYLDWYNNVKPVSKGFWDIKIDRPLANLDKSDGVIPTCVRKELEKGKAKGKKIRKK